MPAEIHKLSSLNVGDYYDVSTMSYMYHLEVSNQEKEKQEKVEKANKRHKIRRKAANSNV